MRAAGFVSADLIDRCWPWLLAALEQDEARTSPDQLRTLLHTGKAQLWPGEGGALVTQLINTDGRRFLHCWLGGGDMQALVAMKPGVEAWGRAQGAEFASINGRRGWVRMFKDYRREGRELVKDLR